MKEIKVSFLLVISVLSFVMTLNGQTSFNIYFSMNYTSSQITYDESKGILEPFFIDDKVTEFQSKNMLSNFNIGVNIEHKLSEYLIVQLRTGYSYQHNPNDRQYIESYDYPAEIKNPNDSTQYITVRMKNGLSITPDIKMTGWFLSPVVRLYPFGLNNTPISLNFGINLSYVSISGHFNYSYKKFYKANSNYTEERGLLSEFKGKKENLINSIPITMSYDIKISNFVVSPELGVQFALDIPEFPVY